MDSLQQWWMHLWNSYRIILGQIIPHKVCVVKCWHWLYRFLSLWIQEFIEIKRDDFDINMQNLYLDKRDWNLFYVLGNKIILRSRWSTCLHDSLRYKKQRVEVQHNEICKIFLSVLNFNIVSFNFCGIDFSNLVHRVHLPELLRMIRVALAYLHTFHWSFV